MSQIANHKRVPVLGAKMQSFSVPCLKQTAWILWVFKEMFKNLTLRLPTWCFYLLVENRRRAILYLL